MTRLRNEFSRRICEQSATSYSTAATIFIGAAVDWNCDKRMAQGGADDFCVVFALPYNPRHGGGVGRGNEWSLEDAERPEAQSRRPPGSGGSDRV
jgi:hypothetical protein